MCQPRYPILTPHNSIIIIIPQKYWILHQFPSTQLILDKYFIYFFSALSMFRYLPLVCLLYMAHASIFPLNPIQNCQKLQKNSLIASCIQCNQGYKLVKGACMKCQPNDLSFDCKDSIAFSYGSNSVSQINLSLKYQAVAKVENLVYKPGSAPNFDQAEVDNSEIVKDNATVSENITKNYNSSDAFNLSHNFNETDFNQTLFQDYQNTTNSSNSSSQDVQNQTNILEVSYVEYKKDFKSEILSPSDIAFDQVNLQPNSGVQILNLQKPKFNPIFILDQKYSKGFSISSSYNKPQASSGQELCLQWVQISPFVKQCISCKEDYLPSTSGQYCKKINSGIRLPSSQPYNDQNCRVINYFARMQGSDLCSQCKQDYIYSRISKKCVAKDPFCELYEEGVCKKCVDNFQLSADKSVCLLKIK